MGVYIRGMEMPTTCGKCRIKNAIECDRWKLVRSVVLDRHRDCPLVPVSEPHGRLRKRIVYRGEVYNAIEAARVNALDGILSDSYKDGFHDGLKRALEILANVEDAPTIIEPEPCNDLAKPNNTIFAVQNADEDERLFEAKPIDYMHTPSVEEIIEADGLDSFIKHFED